MFAGKTLKNFVNADTNLQKRENLHKCVRKYAYMCVYIPDIQPVLIVKRVCMYK